MINIKQEPITKQFIKQFLPDNPVIIEAGAHIGRDTVKMAKLWPEATIYAFEPVPDLFAQLKTNTAPYPIIHCYPIALSNKVGEATMHVSSGASTAASSLLKPKEYTITRPEVHFSPITVATITLDAWAHENTITHLDFLWLDMQGHELDVLKASPIILKTVKAILIEVSLTERFKNNPLYQEVINWLTTQDFTPIQQDIPKHNKINILAIKA